MLGGRSMSVVNKDKAFERAVDLVINQDRSIHSWTGRYVAVQTSLVVAETGLLAWKAGTDEWAIMVLGILVAAAAVIFLHLMTVLICREHRWQGLYVEWVKAIEGQEPFLWKQEYKKIPGPNIAKVFWWMRIFLTVGWFVFIGVFVFVAAM